ncbi:efflux RND transporter periplasmic adaptor subunit [Frigoriflavimonas asaccharolytica]|uniref:Multidrug efflux pump subunit AcrA (Membrane-fusion protein) n=1 Tax=Frigoriflavimonas asaccharolytica TaxID=2735899 RepID=A0A8J8GAI4_9FLAO|nr:efflux RND transporter periplasmic adaptor subunit [Frigoriflavimonas asaccharolytica]NRS94028.1 multidrug efflux pump subunit AcrA (membrane-fusion protein) [Frigoriflavimonas asaccharolytica]
MIKILKLALIFTIAFSIFSCKKNESQTAIADAPVNSATPVSVVFPTDTLSINNSVSINATATYLLKSDVKANATGYITNMRINLGDQVRKGQLLFSVQTKESRALGNTINKLDKSFRFSGVTTVICPATGYVNLLNHQIGDYVQEGEILAGITDSSSFGFVMNVPYEYHEMLINNKNLKINLPDGKSIDGHIAKLLPSVDAVSQTQQVLVKPNDNVSIPENLIVSIDLKNQQNGIGIYVPKSAVLTDETQTKFWVMKLKNNDTAVKIDVVKGTENENYVQIISGNISLKDKIISTGNYGLENNAKVKVEN